MKKIYMLIIFLLLIIGCTKNNNLRKSEKDSLYNTSQYIKDNYAWIYTNEHDIGKIISEVKNKIKIEFGEKVQVYEYKIVNEVKYYKIDYKNSKYWISKDSMSKGFAVIINNDVPCYDSQSDESILPIKLQKGAIGTIKIENDKWINIDIRSYYQLSSTTNFYQLTGTKWIKNNKELISKDTDLAKEAYYYNLAYYNKNIIQNKNINDSIFFINKGLDTSKSTGKTSFITIKLKDLLDKINKEK